MTKKSVSNTISDSHSKNFATRQDKIRELQKDGIKAQGKTERIAFLSGKRLTRNQAIKADCYECMGWYADGKEDCQNPDCSLYQYMPYAQKITTLAAPLQAPPAKNGRDPVSPYPPQTENTQNDAGARP